MVVPSGPGGTLDFVARKVGQKLSESFKQPVIVENKPGASGMIAISHVMRSAPDGLTLTIGTTGSYPMNFVARKNAPFHPIKDFSHLSLAVESDYILAVHPSVPAKTLQEFIALAKKDPNALNYSSFGPGSASHFFMEAFSFKAGIKLMHVPYKSAPDALMGLVSGQVQAAFDTAFVLAPQIKDGRLRALAIAGERSTLAPEVPTFAEAGLPDVFARAWFGFFAPAGTPEAIVKRINTEVVQALRSPEMRKDLEASGLRVIGSSPEQLAEQIRKDIEIYEEVAAAANIRLD
jgi:tripartite-type tricarboxylate transporter receptor subunit TctC